MEFEESEDFEDSEEFEVGSIKFVEAGPDTVLDVLARGRHYETPAARAHWSIAAQLWPHLKALEYTTGRLLAVGPDIDLLAGAPPGTPRVTDYIEGYQGHEVMAADLPGGDQWPHTGLRLRTASEDTDGPADLVIANLPQADTRLLARDNKIDIVMSHHAVIQGALTWLRPGGLLVTLAHRQLLDGPDGQPRRSISRQADLIAAVRLPASALRQAPLQDSPVDLLLLRRREPGHPPAGLEFINRSPVQIRDAPAMPINTCYARAPWAAIGNIVPDPIEPDLTTVAPLSGDFQIGLSDALTTHIDNAIDARLYAQERPSRPPVSRSRPTRPENTPHSRGTDPDTPAL